MLYLQYTHSCIDVHVIAHQVRRDEKRKSWEWSGVDLEHAFLVTLVRRIITTIHHEIYLKL